MHWSTLSFWKWTLQTHQQYIFAKSALLKKEKQNKNKATLPPQKKKKTSHIKTVIKTQWAIHMVSDKAYLEDPSLEAKQACAWSKAGHFWKFCSRVLDINFGRDSRVSKIAFTEKILHTLHDFQLPAYQCEPDRHSTQSQTTLFRPTIQNAVIPSI